MNACNEATLADLSDWVGREELRSDRIDQRTAQALAATLDLDSDTLQEGCELPPLWHWVYFSPNARHSEIGVDGHPQRGGFLPPVNLPNRMWAGGRLSFEQPLRVGKPSPGFRASCAANANPGAMASCCLSPSNTKFLVKVVCAWWRNRTLSTANQRLQERPLPAKRRSAKANSDD